MNKTPGKNILLHVLFVFFLIPFITLILCQSGCKKAPLIKDDEIFYDIRGVWTLNLNIGGSAYAKIKCTFSGGMDRGTVTPESGKPGTYVVGGNHGYQVEFDFWAFDSSNENYDYYIGKFVDSNYMEGTSHWYLWGAVRDAGSASLTCKPPVPPF